VIGRLSGTIVEQPLDGSCIVDVGGVGYEVFVPLGAVGRLPQAPERAVLQIHTHQPREESMVLYGFEDLDDRAAFRALLGVSTIGPKLALSIIGHMRAPELADAIHRQDRVRFKGISGVGKKIVERLMLELQDKLKPSGTGTAGVNGLPVSVSPGAASKPAGPLGVVHGALVQMGFKPSEADAACDRILPRSDGKPTEELLRDALSVIG
jgi:Holliday junction DNA helicase RuvA